tara:strand:- start:950 stop:1225 length:276 start_codon:yes stop_codon:yes gene_type:complete
MEHVLKNNSILNGSLGHSGNATNLSQAEVDQEYTIKAVVAGDEELVSFLFTLGCYEGETVTVISKVSETYVISVKDARYSIDQELAEAILI